MSDHRLVCIVSFLAKWSRAFLLLPLSGDFHQRLQEMVKLRAAGTYCANRINAEEMVKQRAAGNLCASGIDAEEKGLQDTNSAWHMQVFPFF